MQRFEMLKVGMLRQSPFQGRWFRLGVEVVLGAQVCFGWGVEVTNAIF